MPQTHSQKQKKTRYDVPSALCLAVVLLCTSIPSFTAEALILANTNSLLTSLIRLADDQDLYAEYGTQLELITKDTDEMAIRSLINRQADLAVVAGAPFVKHALKHQNLRLIASIGQCDNEIKIAVRKDRAISHPGDLRGKRIGTQPGVAFHLFLDRLLERHGLTQEDITPVFMPADRLPRALANGLIDAMPSHEPYLSQALDLAKDQIDIISAPGLYITSYNLVTTDEFLRSERSASITPLLQALHEAERRLESQPKEMISRLSQPLRKSPDEIERQLLEAKLRLSMDSTLLNALETIAGWLQPTHIQANNRPVDFLSYLHMPLLAAVKPNSVSLH